MRALGIILAAAGAAIVVTARLYHFVEHPEWTEPQALRELWHVLALGGLLLAAAAALAVANYLRRPGPAVPVILTRDNARQLLRPGLYIARGYHDGRIDFSSADEEALLDVFMGHYPCEPEAITAWHDALDEMVAKKLAGRQP